MDQPLDEGLWMTDVGERLAELVAEAVRHLNMENENDGPWNIIRLESDQRN